MGPQQTFGAKLIAENYKASLPMLVYGVHIVGSVRLCDAGMLWPWISSPMANTCQGGSSGQELLAGIKLSVTSGFLAQPGINAVPESV